MVSKEIIEQIKSLPMAQMIKHEPWRASLPHSEDVHILLWITRGQGRITVAGRRSGFGTHNAIFIPAGTMFAIELGTGMFGSAIFLPKDERLGLPQKPVHLRIRDVAAHKEFNANLEQLQRELKSDRPGNDRAAFAYAALLGVWLDRQYAEENSDQYDDAATRLVARYTNLIENKYLTGYNLQHYATALGVTTTHLTRACNQVSGQPASQVLNDRVMYEARRLLSDTKEPVNEIAKSLGFSTPAYFTRAFQSHCALTPSAYRKEQSV